MTAGRGVRYRPRIADKSPSAADAWQQCRHARGRSVLALTAVRCRADDRRGAAAYGGPSLESTSKKEDTVPSSDHRIHPQARGCWHRGRRAQRDLGAVVQLAVQPSTSVSDQMWSYPWSSGAFVPVSIAYAALHALVIAGLVGVRRSGMAGSTRAAAAGASTAIAGTAFLLAGEVASLPIRHDRTDDTGAMVVGAIFGLGVVLSAVGFLILGRESLRSGCGTTGAASRRLRPGCGQQRSSGSASPTLWRRASPSTPCACLRCSSPSTLSLLPPPSRRAPRPRPRSHDGRGDRHRTGSAAAAETPPKAAGWLHLGFAGLIVTGVFVQVYLIGAYIFGAGEGALDLHKSLGYTVHGFEVVLFVLALVAWLPRTDLLLSLLVAVIGTAQIMLAESTG